MNKRIKDMDDLELVDELIKSSHQLGEWSMETYNPGEFNKIEQKRYSEIKKEILRRME